MSDGSCRWLKAHKLLFMLVDGFQVPMFIALTSRFLSLLVISVAKVLFFQVEL